MNHLRASHISFLDFTRVASSIAPVHALNFDFFVCSRAREPVWLSHPLHSEIPKSHLVRSLHRVDRRWRHPHRSGRRRRYSSVVWTPFFNVQNRYRIVDGFARDKMMMQSARRAASQLCAGRTLSSMMTTTTTTTTTRGVSSGKSHALLSDANRQRISEDLRSARIRKLDDAPAHGRRVSLVPLALFNDNPCVIFTVYEDAHRGGKFCGLPSAAVEESTLLESSSVATTNAAKRARRALWGDAESMELLGASHDVVDVQGRTIVTPVLAFLGEVQDATRGRDDVAAISLDTLASLDGVIAEENGAPRFIGTLAASGLRGYEAHALHAALRVIVGPNMDYKEALYDQFTPGYVRKPLSMPKGEPPTSSAEASA